MATVLRGDGRISALELQAALAAAAPELEHEGSGGDGDGGSGSSSKSAGLGSLAGYYLQSIRENMPTRYQWELIMVGDLYKEGGVALAPWLLLRSFITSCLELERNANGQCGELRQETQIPREYDNPLHNIIMHYGRAAKFLHFDEFAAAAITLACGDKSLEALPIDCARAFFVHDHLMTQADDRHALTRGLDRDLNVPIGSMSSVPIQLLINFIGSAPALHKKHRSAPDQLVHTQNKLQYLAPTTKHVLEGTEADGSSDSSGSGGDSDDLMVDGATGGGTEPMTFGALI
eukprot:Filipodium_phascolosomae@DN1145_c0_g1_i1.p1